MTASNDFIKHQGLTLAVLWAGVLGGILVLVYSFLNLPKSLAVASGAILFIIMVSLVLITLGTDMPEKCLSLEFGITTDLTIFPIALVGAGGSLFGLAVSLSWFCTESRSSSGMVALVYFVLVSFFKMAGVIGVMNMSCDQDRQVGFPFYGAWIVSSFLTNLALHQIVVMLAAPVNAYRLLRIISYIFLLEVFAALLLIIGTLYLAVNTVTGANGDVGHGSHENLHDYDLVLVLSIILLVANLSFCCACLIAMCKGSAYVQEIDHAVFFSKVNILVVFLSMLTSTMFYVCFTVTMPTKVNWKSGPEFSAEGSAFLFSSWLVDSLLIDLCVIFVGFGPVATELINDGAASKAESAGSVAASEVVGCSQLPQVAPPVTNLPPPSLPSEPSPPFVPSSVPPSLFNNVSL